MDNAASARVLILGGGFAGLNTAAHLEKLLGGRPDVEITLVNRDNYSLFTPMLAEVAGSGIQPSHIVNPIRTFLRRTRFRAGIVQRIDLENRRVETMHPPTHAPTVLPFDRLGVALRAGTNYRGGAG